MAIQVPVDANSAYRLKDVAHLKMPDEFQLLMVEQPLKWENIHATRSYKPRSKLLFAWTSPLIIRVMRQLLSNCMRAGLSTSS